MNPFHLFVVNGITSTKVFLMTPVTRKFSLFCIVFIFLIQIFMLTGCKSLKNNQLEIGSAIVEITPPAGYPMYRGKSTGVVDPLYARSLVFVQGEVKGAILMCDLIGIPRDLSRIVREQASGKTGIPYQNITIAATHTHTGPSITEDFIGYSEREASGNLTEDDIKSYFNHLINGMIEAIV